MTDDEPHAFSNEANIKPIPMKTNASLDIKHSITRLIRGSNRVAFALLGAATLMVPLTTLHADSTPFSRIFVFGDSLSDTGNFYTLTGGYPPPPYVNGRFSNGKLWVEYAADALQMIILPGDNYAVAGATTGRYNLNNGLSGLTFPGMLDQIDAFQASHRPAEANDALFVVWAGANDVFAALATGTSPQTLISNGVYNTALAIVRLNQSGARHILVSNLPDLGVTPFVLSLGVGAQLTQLSAAYNAALTATLDALNTNGISTIRVNSFATLEAMASHPAQFGFTNVTQPFLTTGGNPDEFLFWDSVHPTTIGHAVLAQEALNSLIA